MKRFVLYRILGNDLPPRHTPEQTLSNLLFILEHEPSFPDCEKRWVVNRIVDQEQESKIVSLLDKYGQKYIHIPFVLDEYAQCRYDIDGLPKELFLHNGTIPAIQAYLRAKSLEYPFRYKNLYAMNNNGARNAALEEGRSLAEWIMPWDGCCFVTDAAWSAILRDMESLQDEKYLIVPMARVYDNLSLLDDAFVPDPAEEPQIAFHRDSVERFDENLRYGYSPKAELLRRLRVPGPWNEWGKVPWEPQSLKDSCEAGKYRHAGWVARLFSGLPSSQDDNLQRHTYRMNGIISKLRELDERVLRQKFHMEALVFYDEAVLSEYKQAWLAGEEQAVGIVGNLLSNAESVLDKGPYSVLDKTAIPPSGSSHDYLSPAAYWWKDTALPEATSERQDGKRLLEAQLYSPEGDRYDRTHLQLVIDHTTLLALAWYFTGDTRFADRAALLIRTWFLNLATRMNPHLRYAQLRMGEEGEQRGYGIIETKNLYFFLDAVRLVFRTGKLSLPEQWEFRQWCRAFLIWLLNSPQGRRIFSAQNNQGTFYDLQVASLAAFLDDARILLKVLRVSTMRSAQQFQPDGSQPQELKRTNSLHYCVFNLYGWFYLNKLAGLAGMDLWNTSTQTGGSPAAGLAWISSFQQREWPYQQQDEFDLGRLTLLRCLASSTARDQGKGSDVPMIGTHGIKPVFHSYAGVQPYWPLSTHQHLYETTRNQVLANAAAHKSFETPKRQSMIGHIAMFHVGRCGSTVLGRMLNQHPSIEWDGEIYEPEGALYYRYGIRADTADPLGFLRQRLAGVAKPRYGFEIKPYQAKLVNLPIERLITSLDELGFTHFVLLYRQNTLRKVVSSLVASSTKRWHVPAGAAVPLAKIRLNVDMVHIDHTGKPLVELLREYEIDMQYIEQQLAGRSVLKLSYEDDLEADPQAGYRKMCGFLGISPTPAVIELGRTTPFLLSEVIENHDEVASALHGTEFEWMMNDTRPR